MTQSLNLAATRLSVSAESGDDVVIPLVARNTNTTGWSLEFVVSVANAAEDEPSGEPVGSGSVTNTPGDPDSDLILRLGRDITAAYPRTSLFGRLRYTYDGSVRTLLEVIYKIQ